MSEEQIREYVERCPAENRWAFEGWLRGERQLDGDPIEPEPADLWKVQLWLGDQLIEEHIAPASWAHQHAAAIRERIKGLPGRLLTCEQVQR
ncbi:hypothetical protein ACQPYH_12150 [Kribbella sp. CA-245084]|uniref:hypothetical protein n=1 Tax=Kribbella sp. CA-245084 TaxID=3239940 RepID=UPI003D8E2AD4